MSLVPSMKKPTDLPAQETTLVTFLNYFILFYIVVKLIYNVLGSGVQQSDSITYIYVDR